MENDFLHHKRRAAVIPHFAVTFAIFFNHTCERVLARQKKRDVVLAENSELVGAAAHFVVGSLLHVSLERSEVALALLDVAEAAQARVAVGRRAAEVALDVERGSSADCIKGVAQNFQNQILNQIIFIVCCLIPCN